MYARIFHVHKDKCKALGRPVPRISYSSRLPQAKTRSQTSDALPRDNPEMPVQIQEFTPFIWRFSARYLAGFGQITRLPKLTLST
jgi:hypothetical protein